jgi:hypothetical protein
MLRTRRVREYRESHPVRRVFLAFAGCQPVEQREGMTHRALALGVGVRRQEHVFHAPYKHKPTGYVEFGVGVRSPLGVHASSTWLFSRSSCSIVASGLSAWPQM